MRYMLLIHSDESGYEKMSEEEMGKLMMSYGAYSEEIVAKGGCEYSDRLRPTSTATTVRVRDGETISTDGPFAETKEQFGGFYQIDVPDLDAAIEWAAKCPTASYGSIEFRPIWEME
jgi:hypothetical protein